MLHLKDSLKDNNNSASFLISPSALVVKTTNKSTSKKYGERERTKREVGRV
jgi:hypothetical protein